MTVMYRACRRPGMHRGSTRPSISPSLDIPNGLRNISIKLNSINNYTKVESFNPCGHAFISKQGTFTFSIDSLRTLRLIEVICQWFLIGRSVL